MSSKMILAVAIAITSILGVGTRAVSAQPRITDAVLGTDSKEKADGYEIVNATSEFRPDTAKLVCVFKVAGAGIGTSVRGVWIAEDVGPVAPPNYKIDEKSLTLPFINAGRFSLTKPNGGWPVGAYRLEIYFGDVLAKTVKFTVKAP